MDRPRLDKDQTGYGDHYRLYRCSDGVWIQVAAVNDTQKAAFDNIARGSDFQNATAAEWQARLTEAGVPVAISDAKASLTMFDDASMKERGWTVEYQHPYVGKLEQIGTTYSLSDTPTVEQTPPLIVGDNSVSLLVELGYSEEEIDAMAKEFAILCDPPREGQEAMKSPWGI